MSVSTVVILAVVCGCFANGVAESEDLSKHPNLALLPPSGECGQPGLPKTVSTINHDGQMQNATIGMFPFVALLGYPESGKIKYKCLGTLISKRHVLTSFECLSKHNGGLPVSVRLGYVNASEENNCNSENSICHPPQDIAVKDVTINGQQRQQFRNDVVMLHLASDAVFNEFVQPVCLPIGGKSSKNLTEATAYSYTWRSAEIRFQHYPVAAVGFSRDKVYAEGGAAGGGGDVIGEDPQATPAPCTSRRCKRRRETGLLQYAADIIVEKSECLNSHAYGSECEDCPYSLKTTICVEMEETKNYCHRESGSPVVYAVPSLEEPPKMQADVKPTFYLAGIIQRDVSCYSTVTAVATSAHDLLKWILDHLSYCTTV